MLTVFHRRFGLSETEETKLEKYSFLEVRILVLVLHVHQMDATYSRSKLKTIKIGLRDKIMLHNGIVLNT